ncbi:MAG: Integrin-like protein [Acidobacteriales bacterium]|nr:Integrin-like protein [Terriglobales bacterium]
MTAKVFRSTTNKSAKFLGMVSLVLGLFCQPAFCKGFQSAKIFSAGRLLSGLVVADFNNDGKPDLLVIENPGSGLNNTIHVLLSGGPSIFGAPIDSNAGVNLSSVVAWDFNGDGILDIAVTDSVANTITILLGNSDLLGKGDGTFTFKTSLPAGNTPIAVALGDFDSDGIKDLAVIDSGDSTLHVYTVNHDGTGNITPKGVFMLGPDSIPVALTTADIDNDGKVDIAVLLKSNNSPITLSSSFVVLKGKGDGTLNTPTPSFIPVFNATSIAAVDLNEDGIQDVMITTDKVLYVRGSGSLVFQTPVPLDAQSRPASIAIADMNNDGHFDIVVGNSFSSSITVFANDGFSGITSVQSTSVVDSPIAIGIADFNGDGIPDVVAINALPTNGFGQANIQLVLGNGDGLMRGAFPFDYSSAGASGSAISGVVDDFDQDGRPDIAVADAVGRVTVLKNVGNFKFVPVLPANPVSVGSNMVSADVDSNGQRDLVLAGFDKVSVLLGQGNGTFVLPGTAFSVPSGNHYIALGDFNKDGKIDLVFTNALGDANQLTVGVVFGNGDGTFKPLLNSDTYNVGLRTTSVAIGDFNGDGNVDLAVVVQGEERVAILLGSATGVFTIAPLRPVLGSFPSKIIAADLNKDGILDLVVANTGNGQPVASLSVLFGNGNGTFKTAVVLPLKAFPESIVVTDFNADSFPDIAAGEHGGFIEVFSNNGNNTFSLPQQLAAGSASGAISLLAADMNNGGVPDLVAINSQAIVLPNTGGIKMAAAVSPSPSSFKQPVNLVAGVKPNVPGMPLPMGTMQFKDATASLGIFDVPLSGSVQIAPSLVTGSHSLSSIYSGDDNYYARTAFAGTQLVNKAATISSIIASTLKSIVGVPVAITGSFNSIFGGGLTGTASLLDGSTVIASSLVDGLGNASFKISNLTTGLHSLSVKYPGDLNFTPGSSSPLSLNVIDFNISISRPGRSKRDSSAQQSQSGFQVEVSAVGAEAQPVHLACGPLPTGMSCSFAAQDFLLQGSRIVDVLIDSPSRAARLKTRSGVKSFSVDVSFISGNWTKKITVPIQAP